MVTAPTVKLDKAGVITGMVTARDGKPVTQRRRLDQRLALPSRRRGCRHRSTGPVHAGRPGPVPVAAGVHHPTTAGNGPAAREIGTPPRPYRWQAGKTVTYDEIIREQSRLTGTVTLRTGKLQDGFLMAHTASTGDPIGDIWFWADGKFTMTVPGGERVKIEYAARIGKPDDLTGWYDRAKTYEKATIVEVPASGAKTLNVTVG